MQPNNKPMPARLQAKQAAVKKYYFLASGTVMFFPVDKPEDVGSVQLNTVFTTKTGMVPVSGIADAQRGLQQQASDRMAKVGITIQIVDVQVVAISKLGHMLPSEFHDLEESPAKPADVAPAKVQ